MKTWLLISLLPLLGACAGASTVARDGTATGTEPLTLTRLAPHDMEVRLDGTPYAGDWSDAPCFTDGCRGEFRNVLRMYRRHIRHGEAELLARNGARLACQWVSYRDQVRGACQAPDGRSYSLEAYGI